MSDPVALSLIAGLVTLGTAFLGAWGRRQATAPFGTETAKLPPEASPQA